MTVQYLTLVHILISLVGLAAGFGAVSGLIAGKLLNRWMAVFLTMTAATSVTGFFFPFQGVTPAIAVGVVSLFVLAVACYALYIRRLSGVWRRVFVISAVLSLYLNVFVLIVQTFQKNPALVQIAPELTAPPFAITQAVVFGVFVWLGWISLRRFRSDSLPKN
jgi:hypothetical protein